MTTPTYALPVTGENIAVQISQDGGTTYGNLVLINTTRQVDFSANFNTDEVPSISNPALPAQTIRTVNSTDFKVSGAGILDANSVSTYANLCYTGQIVPAKIQITNPTGANTVSTTWTGNVGIETFSISGEARKLSTVSISIVQAGQMTQTTP